MNRNYFKNELRNTRQKIPEESNIFSALEVSKLENNYLSHFTILEALFSAAR